ncbi:MAG: DUF4124 domain-containing protein [Methyloversatilis sp.]|jgi:hypothetical protein|uniref:DUF4124 domain-containing protein n=1 Tax=Methyloversatilis universalis (strain ATCC BAA-1314 / DSM 25237 / JCM 13912 / CCUG 52030 / FAM5) TaxID=1000565 RepID=F5R7H6_METUF|nr:DUF4124 domain-containing protein [Methyloversatilis universalis]EGK73455.1 hypothetical protein METUNv1_00082 [Methyloversatilis universalis FAM5]MCP4637194.1 DUF4124 domain-containing protein [Methyloversatilis sp.]
MFRGCSRFLIATAAALCVLPAHADVFKCVGPDGHVTYTNDKSNARGCKTLSSEMPVSSVPGPAAAPAKPANSGGSFPSVSGDQQKARDGERRRILEAELDTESKSLEAARKALAEGEAVRLGDERNYQKYLDRIQGLKDNVSLHERNVDALRKELSKLP